MSKLVATHSPEPCIADVAALIGDPGRTAMLLALLDRGQLPAGELAYRAGVSPAAASGHLSKLLDGGLLHARRVGRQRLYRIASAEVGRALEALAVIAKPTKIVALAQNIATAELRAARSCYDHLAGRLGVEVTDALVERDAIVPGPHRDYRLTKDGQVLLKRLGVDVGVARAKRREFARQCIDWTEGRPHLAGALGAALLDRLFASGWVERSGATRALRITPAGRAALAAHFGVSLP